jgi:lipopolysaccharide export system permease protein
MNILHRYISQALIRGWTIILAILTSIFGLLAFVEELDRVRARYQTIDALLYVAGTLPQIAMDLAPIIALLGTMIALAGLARNSEIIAMRAAGISSSQFVGAMLIPSLGLIVTLYLFGEFVAAPMQQRAEEQRSVQRTGKGNILKGRGLWMTDGEQFLNVSKLRQGAIPAEINVYQLDNEGRLAEYIHARRADPGKDRSWILHNIMRKRISSDGTMETKRQKTMEIGPFWAPDEIPVLPLPTSTMPLVSLYGYIQYLKSTGQPTKKRELSFWKRATLPLSAGLMILLAIPIGTNLGSQRGTEYAKKLAIGAMIGIAFYLLTRIIRTLGLVLGLPVLVTTILPLLLILVSALVLLRRMR